MVVEGDVPRSAVLGLVCTIRWIPPGNIGIEWLNANTAFTRQTLAQDGPLQEPVPLGAAVEKEGDEHGEG